MIKKIETGDVLIEMLKGRRKEWYVIGFDKSPSGLILVVLRRGSETKTRATRTLFNSPAWDHSSPEKRK